MKWYSRNDDSGYVMTSELDHLDWWYRGDACWLIIKLADGRYSGGHGSGNPANPGGLCYLNESYYTNMETGEYVTERVRDENGNYVRKEFMQPYYGCSDSHTYISFLEGDVKQNGSTVYFYNPDFPDYDSYEDLVLDQIEKEYEEYEKQGLLNYVDWREIIYQMAKDYYQHNTEDDFELRVRENNLSYYPTGRTGYERYYIDLQGFWRQLYNPALEREEEEMAVELAQLEAAIPTLKQQLNATNNAAEKKVIASQIETTNQKIEDLKARQIKNQENQKVFYGKDDENPYWHHNVYEYPHLINFWFDFLDAETELAQFNVQNVGSRSKSVNETTIKSIYFRETPDIIFESPNSIIQPMSGYKYI
jgi:hypothetical protein